MSDAVRLLRNLTQRKKIWSIGIDDISMHLNALIGLDDLSSDSSYISHWMPLPESPKEDV